MIEFLQENVFFIVVTMLMFWCHFSHHSHGRDGEKTPPDGSKQK